MSVKNAKPVAPTNDPAFEWCIVGNIVDQHYWGEDKIIKRGAKQFRPGAKVYCFPEFGGMAHDKMRVLGQPRKQNRLINVIISTRLITNFRIKKVYHPKVRLEISKHVYYRSRKDWSTEDFEEMIAHLSSLSSVIE